MAKLFRRRRKKVGLSPGTLVYTGEERAAEVRIRIIDYDEAHLEEREAKTVEECFPFKDTPTVTWLNIDGLHRVDIVEALGSRFEVHPLVLEDILNTGQRPKMEDFDGYIFVVLNMLLYDAEREEVDTEQISLVVGPNYVLSFQERSGDVFDAVRERIRSAKGRIRKMGADYLAYALLDAIVDGYFTILEKLGERIESIEDRLVEEPTPETLHAIHEMKREVIFLRKSVWPLREVISALTRGESKLFKKPTLVYLRDVYDHTIQVIDTVETFRDVISGMTDVYLSVVSNRMNEIMKVLTLIATIFIPLTFVAGVYGMNFAFMPELSVPWAYPVILIAMSAAAFGMVLYFRRRGWL